MMTKKDNTSRYLKLLKREPLLYDAAQELRSEAGENGTARTDLLVLCPVMHSYVIWLLRKAVDSGIVRLYFLSRDGYLPYLTARELCRHLQLPVECRYLYCSRASLRIPMYHRNIPEALAYICRGGIDVTPYKILSRAGIATEDMDPILEALDLGYAADETIPYAGLTGVREKLSRCAPFLDQMTQISRGAMPALRAYFMQEGLLDDVPWAMVDSGWTGSMQKSIRDILAAIGGERRPKGFYFGLYYLPGDCQPDDYRSYYFTPRSGLIRKAFFNNNLFEVVYSAPHGTTTGYCFSGESVEPVLGTPDPQIAAYMESLERLSTGYTKRLLAALAPEQFPKLDTAHLCRVSAQLLRVLMWSPDQREADCYGALPFSDDLHDVNRQDLAPVMDLPGLRQNHVLHKLMVMLGLRKEQLRESAWYEASAVRSAPYSLWHRLQHLIYKLLLYMKPR